jgi:hypothetical protein
LKSVIGTLIKEENSGGISWQNSLLKETINNIVNNSLFTSDTIF